MDIALVTGASSQLGTAIALRLIELGLRVYGLGGDYSKCPINNIDFIPVTCDLADPNQVMDKVAAIIKKEGAIYAIINNARFSPRDSLAQTSPAELDRALRINLLAPLLIARCALPDLCRLQGYIINLGAATPDTSRGGAIGAACSGGIRWASEALFHELREQGVKVTSISPEPNRWRPEDAPPSRSERSESMVDPQAIAHAVGEILMNRNGNIVTEMVIRPQRLKERDIDSVLRLPYPEPKPIPYTVPREWVDAEELLDAEEELAAELAGDSIQPDESGSQHDEERSLPADPSTTESDTAAQANGKTRKRRRGRRGGKRDINEEAPQAIKADTPEPQQQLAPAPEKKPETSSRIQLKPRPPAEQPAPSSSSPTPTGANINGTDTEAASEPTDSAEGIPAGRRKRRRRNRRRDDQPTVITFTATSEIPKEVALLTDPVILKPDPKLLQKPRPKQQARSLQPDKATAKPAPAAKPAPVEKQLPVAKKQPAPKPQPDPTPKQPAPSAKTATKAATKTAAKKATARKTTAEKAPVKKAAKKAAKKASRPTAAKKTAAKKD